jgi:hypothetical protein
MNFSGCVSTECQITFINKLKGKRGVIAKLFFSTTPEIHQRLTISVTNREEFFEA